MIDASNWPMESYAMENVAFGYMGDLDTIGVAIWFSMDYVDLTDFRTECTVETGACTVADYDDWDGHRFNVDV